MTIPSASAWASVNGTGTTGPFNIPFVLYSQTHLTVLSITAGVVSTLNLGTDYHFSSFVPDTKGQVAAPQITTTNAVSGGTTLIFLLIVPGLQNTAVTNFPAFFASSHEAEFDQLQQQINQLSERMNKAVRAPDYEFAGQTIQTMPSIANRLGKIAGWDGAGNLTALVVASTGSVTFSTLGLTIANIANLTALLSLLGINIVANQGALAGLTPVANFPNFAFQLDTSDFWVYNFQASAWYKFGTALP